MCSPRDGSSAGTMSTMHKRKEDVEDARDIARYLVTTFFARVWSPPHDLSAIDELMTPEYVITTAGTEVRGRAAFKEWVRQFHEKVTNATNEHLDIIVGDSGDKVVSRWICRGNNNGLYGSPADGRAISFTGIAIWRIENGRLAECWVERSAWELYQTLTAPTVR